MLATEVVARESLEKSIAKLLEAAPVKDISLRTGDPFSVPLDGALGSALTYIPNNKLVEKGAECMRSLPDICKIFFDLGKSNYRLELRREYELRLKQEIYVCFVEHHFATSNSYSIRFEVDLERLEREK